MRPASRNIVDMIERQAERQPQWPAVISGDEQISYGELVLRLKALSALLGSKNIGSNMPVGVCADRSVSWIVAMLGVLHCGGMYVPISPAAPLQRKTKILATLDIRSLLVDRHGRAVASPSVDIELIDQIAAAGQQTRERPALSPGQTAYAISTSGSTASPKTVLVSYDSIWHYAEFLREEIAVDRDDRYLQTASIEVSASIRQVLAPLISGATLVLAGQDEILEPMRLALRMIEARVTIFDTVPSYLVHWLAGLCELPAEYRHSLAASLKQVFTTGEPLTAYTANSLWAALPKVKIFNLYGQTETTGTVAIHPVATPAVDPIPIGGIAKDCHFYVLSDEDKPLAEGELCISGPCLASQYHNAPELNASVYISDLFCREPGRRMYRTRDRVRRLEDGTFEFVGRVDRQVKFHGFRVELDEIEAALRTYSDVAEAAVIVRNTGEQESRLIAFVVTRAGAVRPTDLDLRTFLSASLSEIMIPGTIAFLDTLPRTESGKIDYPALSELDLSSPADEDSPAAPPATATEKFVAQCWEDVLAIRGVGADDHFFALGGDSLQAIQMLILIQHRIGKTLPFSSMFFFEPTVRAFAEAIDRFGAMEAHGQTIALP